MFRFFSLLEDLDSVGGILSALIALAALAFSLWMAFDCWQRGGDGYWIFLILGTGGTFALIYFFTQYWHGTRTEYSLWRRLTMIGQIRERRTRAHQLNTAGSYEALGDILLSVRKYAEAETAYRAALARQSDLFDVRVRLGYALVGLGRAEEAAPLLSRAYEQKPTYDNDELAWKLARCQAARGHFEDARNLFAYFLTKHSYSEAQIEHAQVLAAIGDRDAAQAALTELIADIDYSPRYARRRERAWRRRARKVLRSLQQPPPPRR